jgi:hypothetical protein
MLTHCCVGYLKLTNVQNVHHQHQFIVESDMQQSAVLALLPVQ